MALFEGVRLWGSSTGRHLVTREFGGRPDRVGGEASAAGDQYLTLSDVNGDVLYTVEASQVAPKRSQALWTVRRRSHPDLLGDEVRTGGSRGR